MKKLLFILSFLIAFSSFGQIEYSKFSNSNWGMVGDELSRSFKTFQDFQSYKEVFEDSEHENMKPVKDGSGRPILIWGVVRQDPDPLIMLWVKSRTRSIANEISYLDKRDFKAFTDFVSRRLLRWFIEFSHKYNKVYNDIDFFHWYPEINFDFTYGDAGRKIASAHSPLEGDVRIIVNIDKWEKLNNYQRIWLILHEWGHEAFGMEHGDNILMYPIMPDEELLKTGTENVVYMSEKRDFLRNRGFYEADISDSGVRNLIREIDKAETETFLVPKGERNYQYTGMGDSTTVTVAFNILFDSAMDFFDDLFENGDLVNSKVIYEIQEPFNEECDNCLLGNHWLYYGPKK